MVFLAQPTPIQMYGSYQKRTVSSRIEDENTPIGSWKKFSWAYYSQGNDNAFEIF